ncbi:hypothetical protein T484DRAFT_1765231 [Baffinella frigidus]|nr:hypothetical protein T484DRAFT_1765231 [Cryptophyta sp. CCMP2293]
MPKAPLKRPPAKDVGSEKPTPDSLLDNLAQVAIDDDRCAMGVGAFAGLIYLATMHRTLAGGDSGDLIANACSLGVPHPPGYPLHTLLAALFVRLIPFGSPALRVNLLSVLAAAVTKGSL